MTYGAFCTFIVSGFDHGLVGGKIVHDILTDGRKPDIYEICNKRTTGNWFDMGREFELKLNTDLLPSADVVENFAWE